MTFIACVSRPNALTVIPVKSTKLPSSCIIIVFACSPIPAVHITDSPIPKILNISLSVKFR